MLQLRLVSKVEARIEGHRRRAEILQRSFMRVTAGALTTLPRSGEGTRLSCTKPRIDFKCTSLANEKHQTELAAGVNSTV